MHESLSSSYKQFPLGTVKELELCVSFLFLIFSKILLGSTEKNIRCLLSICCKLFLDLSDAETPSGA